MANDDKAIVAQAKVKAAAAVEVEVEVGAEAVAVAKAHVKGSRGDGGNGALKRKGRSTQAR